MPRRAGPRSPVVAPFALVALTGIVTAADGHHSVLPYDNARAAVIAGSVERIAFANPHTILVVGRKLPDGSIERWTIESESAAVLTRLGWNDGIIGVGDRVTAIGAPARDGSTTIRCRQLELEDGRTLLCFPMN